MHRSWNSTNFTNLLIFKKSLWSKMVIKKTFLGFTDKIYYHFQTHLLFSDNFGTLLSYRHLYRQIWIFISIRRHKLPSIRGKISTIFSPNKQNAVFGWNPREDEASDILEHATWEKFNGSGFKFLWIIGVFRRFKMKSKIIVRVLIFLFEKERACLIS